MDSSSPVVTLEMVQEGDFLYIIHNSLQLQRHVAEVTLCTSGGYKWLEIELDDGTVLELGYEKREFILVYYYRKLDSPLFELGSGQEFPSWIQHDGKTYKLEESARAEARPVDDPTALPERSRYADYKCGKERIGVDVYDNKEREDWLGTEIRIGDVSVFAEGEDVRRTGPLTGQTYKPVGATFDVDDEADSGKKRRIILILVGLGLLVALVLIVLGIPPL